MKIIKDIDASIFREYDIRGIYDKNITEDVAYTIGRAFATYMNNVGEKTIIVGHDNRKSHLVLFPALIKGLTDSGANVINLNLVTTPMLNFAKILYNVNCGIMLTASHNTKEYNGFKIYHQKEEAFFGENLQKLREMTVQNNFIEATGQVFELDITKDYLKNLKNSIQLGSRKVKVVIDLGNGTGADFIKDVLDLFDIEYELLYSESDSDFPNHTPDPAVTKNMVDLGKKVTELGYDLGLAVDGDCDRCGMVLEDGSFVSADLIMLMFYRDLADKMSIKKAIFDVKCSNELIDELSKINLQPIMNRTGSVYCRKTMNDLNLAFGGEYSGHLFFKDKYQGFDDGIYGVLRIIELLSKSEGKISSLLENNNKYYSTEELKVTVSEDEKFLIVDEIEKYAKSKKYEISKIDGIRVTFRDSSWALIRASNTGPHLTVRFEAKTKERLAELQKEFMNEIKKNNFEGTPHNKARKGDIASTVIMPGDPLRAKYIAEKYLENYKLVNDVRNMYAYTGTYKGKKITVMSHGMGIPSMGIYSYELYKFYDVQKIIRIGSCGAYDKNLKLFDIVLSEKVYSESNFAKTLNNERCHLVEADKELNEKIIAIAKKNNINLRVGNTVCTDCFDAYMTNIDKFLSRIPRYIKPIACEMEAFALFYIAKILKKKAVCLMSVVDSKHIDVIATPEEREVGLNKMIELALESII